MRTTSRRWAIAPLLVAMLAVSARAQVPADTARRDSTARRDTSARSDSVAAPPTVADSAVVRRLTESGASVRPGARLYHVFVIAPRQAAVIAPPHTDSAGTAVGAVRRDSATVSRSDTVRAAATTVGDSAAVPGSAAAAGLGSTAPPSVVALDTTDLGTRTSSLTPTTYGGGAAWMLVSAGGRGVRATVDTLVLAQADLRPLHLGGLLGLTRLAAELPGDSLFAAMSDPTGRRSVVAAVPRDAILSLEMLDALVQVLPLAAGWSDSVHIAVIAPPTVTVDPAVLAVVGEESAATPLGPVPCWVLELRSPSTTARLWVTKDARTVVRVQQPLRSPVGALLERVYAGGTTP